MEQIIILAMFSITWSLFYTLSQPTNDTAREIIISTWMWACIPLWIALMIYDIFPKQNFVSWVALIGGNLWTRFMSKLWKWIMEDTTQWLRKIINAVFNKYFK